MITYRSVIKGAIKGFNDIQNALATTFDSTLIGAVVETTNSDGSKTISNAKTPDEIVSAIENLAMIRNGNSYISGPIDYIGTLTITPSIGGTSISKASTYGITTTKPSGTDGTNFLTIDPSATRSPSTSKGYVNLFSVASGTNYYIPIVSPTFTGGNITSNAALTPTNAILETTNNSGIIIKATSSATSTAVTYNTTAKGVISKESGATALSAKTSATTAHSTTKYLKELTLAENKTLNKATFNGTVSTLDLGANSTITNVLLHKDSVDLGNTNQTIQNIDSYNGTSSCGIDINNLNADVHISNTYETVSFYSNDGVINVDSNAGEITINNNTSYVEVNNGTGGKLFFGSWKLETDASNQLIFTYGL